MYERKKSKGLSKHIEALAYARGEHGPGTRITYVPVKRLTPVNVWEIRQNLGLSQSKFAAGFGFTPATVKAVQNRWRRAPSPVGLACRLLPFAPLPSPLVPSPEPVTM